MLRFGWPAELVTCSTADGRRFVLEAWRDDPQAGLGEAELALAESLVAACIPAVERSFLVDREHEDRFGAAVLEAEELGTADRALPDHAVARRRRHVAGRGRAARRPAGGARPRRQPPVDPGRAAVARPTR